VVAGVDHPSSMFGFLECPMAHVPARGATRTAAEGKWATSGRERPMRGIDWEDEIVSPFCYPARKWGMEAVGHAPENRGRSTRTTSNIPRTQRVGWVSSISNHHAPAASG
jgi:hypothetical protein